MFLSLTNDLLKGTPVKQFENLTTYQYFASMARLVEKTTSRSKFAERGNITITKVKFKSLL